MKSLFILQLVCCVITAMLALQLAMASLQVRWKVWRYEMDIQRRAINIPLDFQLEGLVLEINITNCDGTKYKKTHQFLK